MSLNLGGLATLSSITLSRPGGDDGETLATLKLSIGTKDTDPICAALGTDFVPMKKYRTIKYEPARKGGGDVIRRTADAVVG